MRLRYLFLFLSLFVLSSSVSAETFSLSGKVTELGVEEGIPHLKVHVISQKSMGTYVDVVTDSEGKFKIDEAEPGDYSLLVEPPDTYTKGMMYASVPADCKKEVVINVRKSGYITGTVTDATGSPIKNGLVIVSARCTDGYHDSERVKEDGSYYLHNLIKGDYTVNSKAAGYNTQTIKDVHLDELETVTLDFKLGAPDQGIKGKAYSISKTGEIITHEGDFVQAVCPDGQNILGFTDKSGRYILKGIEAGQCRLAAARMQDGIGCEQQVTVEEGKYIEIDLILKKMPEQE